MHAAVTIRHLNSLASSTLVTGLVHIQADHITVQQGQDFRYSILFTPKDWSWGGPLCCGERCHLWGWSSLLDCGVMALPPFAESHLNISCLEIGSNFGKPRFSTEGNAAPRYNTASTKSCYPISAAISTVSQCTCCQQQRKFAWWWTAVMASLLANLLWHRRLALGVCSGFSG